ncbi:MAG TPA: hypothetical protein VHV10_05850, partial [Ktedonobacteraceae bacterium]|nr:hypothetical protein [Ktedonobacteraceae bacterium]
PAPLAAEKSKKHQIPFVALALMVLFTSLYIFSVAGLKPVALADKLTHLDASATPPDQVDVPPDQSVSELISMGNLTLGSGDKCEDFHSVVEGDKFCWNKNDFYYGARDSTCIYNPNATTSGNATIPLHVEFKGGSFLKGEQKAWGDAKPPLSLSAVSHNQNTCTDNSTCVSDNASHSDSASELHAQTGGDDIVCGNNACTNTNAGGNTNECGETTNGGKQLAYDRFGCQMLKDKFTIESKKDAKIVKQKQKALTPSVDGIAINPTAYNPNGALYLLTASYNSNGAGKVTIDAGSTAVRPTCDTTINRWTCAAQDGVIPNVVIVRHMGNFAKKDKGNQITTVKRDAPVPVFLALCDKVDGGWAFPCSDQEANSSMPFISTDDTTQSLDHGMVTEGMIKIDWLSGHSDPTVDDPLPGKPRPGKSRPAVSGDTPGHLEYTYLKDTINQPGVMKLFPYTMGLGFAFISPVLVLIGYQLLWASWTYGRAGAMDAFGRMILSMLAIVVSHQLAEMLIQLVDMINLAVVQFHVAMGYPEITIDTKTTTFTLVPQGENDPTSFRGIVVPISRWGCIANDFVALLSNKFWTDAAGFIPFVGGIAKFIGNVFNAIDVAKHIGEFVVLILSINLCTQVFMRLILVNYYIVTAPVAFGCWGLPGGVGQNVVSSWTKGFCSLLFSQTIQIFVLTTFPLILPTFPYLPADRFGILNVLFDALPRILVLVAVIKVPTLMGTQATKAIAQAGTVAGGAVAAAGAMAMNVV